MVKALKDAWDSSERKTAAATGLGLGDDISTQGVNLSMARQAVSEQGSYLGCQVSVRCRMRRYVPRF
jgi:hypothetical protein